MPKTHPRTKLEKIMPEDLAISSEDLISRESKPRVTFVKTEPGEISLGKVRAVLDEMKTKEGIIGYILKNTRSASIDLSDPEKIIEYAILSSSAKETARELSQTFDHGENESVLIEGKNIKLLCLTIGENDISVFMERPVDHTEICKTLCNIS